MFPAKLSFVLANALAGLLWFQPAQLQEHSEIDSGTPSLDAARSLDEKIIAIREADMSRTRPPGAADSVDVTDTEMESFVIYAMADEIPARVDSIDVAIESGMISAATELTFDSEESTGNVIIDMLMESTHSLFVKGMLEGSGGRGKFQLSQVRVDGFPVPLIIVELLVDRFVTPRYPQVDLDEPFDIPWGIEAIILSDGLATITY